MDSDVLDFIQNHYQHELGQELKTSFELFNRFGLSNAEFDFYSLLLNESNEDRSCIGDKFIGMVSQKLDFIIQEHKITLTHSPTLSFKNQLITGLHRLQQLENYEFCLTMLSTETSNVEKLATILAEYTNISIHEYLDHIEKVSPYVLSALYNFCIDSDEIEDEPAPEALLLNLRTLFKTVEGEPMFKELAAYMKLGCEFDLYLSFVIDDLRNIEDPREAAINILILLYMSGETYMNPRAGFDKHFENVFSSLQLYRSIVKHLDVLIYAVEEGKRNAQK